jgi:hypothetical protein
MMKDLKKLRDFDPIDPSLNRKLNGLFGEYSAGYFLCCENSSRWNLAMIIE